MIVTLHIDLSKNCCVDPTERIGGRETDVLGRDVEAVCKRDKSLYSPVGC